eukprot:jgi/Bigna1/130781/aug1.12_g5489
MKHEMKEDVEHICIAFGSDMIPGDVLESECGALINAAETPTWCGDHRRGWKGQWGGSSHKSEQISTASLGVADGGSWDDLAPG